MKLRKVLTSVVALAVAVSTWMVPVAAAEGDIEAGGVYVDKTVYKMTLPTTSAQKFYLDPEGLINATTGPAVDGGTALTASGAGLIVGADPMKAVNNSSVDVKLETTITVAASSGVSVVANNPGAATDKAVYMTLTYDSVGTKVATPVAATVAASSSAVTTEAVMAAAPYQFILKTGAKPGSTNSDDYDYVMQSTGSALSIQIGGNCSTEADWSDYKDGDITLNLVFKFYNGKSDVTSEAGEAVTGDPTIANGTYSRTATNNAYAITNLGSRTISSIYLSIDGSDGTYTFETPAECYSISGNNLVIDGTKNTIGNGAVGSARYLLVTFSDGKTAKFTINVTA